MNILFITIAWPSSGERNLYTDLMDEFVRNGHNVFVTGTQDSEKNTSPDVAVENGIKVLRIQTGKIRKASHIRKAMSLLSLGRKLHTGIKKHFKGIKFDLIICPTPPITISRLIKRLKAKNSANFYLLLKDIWPQGSVDHKVFRKYSLPWIYFRIHEVRMYKTADYIGCMSPLGAEYIHLKNKYIQKDRIEVCPNSIRPAESVQMYISNGIREKYNIPRDACVFIFSGNLGIGHGLHFLVDAIKYLSEYKKAYFVIGGSGTRYQALEKKMAAFKPGNALLYNWLPREDFNRILATSDIGLILLYKYTVPQFPSRLLSYLEYSKPVLCAANKETDVGAIIENSGSGLSVNHGNMPDFVNAVKYFSENESERKRMGVNARKLLDENYTVTHGYNIIMNHF